MSVNSTQRFQLGQGNSQVRVELQNFGVMPQVTIRANTGASGTITVGGTLLRDTIDYSLAFGTFANPCFPPTLYDLADTTATPIVGGVITIAANTTKSYKVDVDMLNEIGFNCASIVGEVEIIVTVEDSQYA